MSEGQIILIVISGLGVIHGLFVAIFLWVYPKGNTLSNKILGLLLIALSIRVGKSVFLEFTEDLDTKIIFSGLSILMIIGPLFYLFIRSCTSKSFKFNTGHLLHFVPAFLGLVFGLWINENHLETLPISLFAFLFLFYYLHLLVYLILSYQYSLRQKKAGLDQDIFELSRMLFIGLLIIWVAYVSNLFDEVVPYIIGPILYSLVAYLLSFIVIQKGYIQKIDHTKYRTTPVSEEQRDRVYKRALQLVVDEQQYKNPEVSLKSLSESLNVSTQVLSLAINQKSNKNFNSLINTYRIEESIRLFQLKEFENLTIAAIAFEVGFNSISSFNTAFKKQTGQTPQDYRNQLTK
jgi:AraC-like DNA-binding protein